MISILVLERIKKKLIFFLLPNKSLALSRSKFVEKGVWKNKQNLR